MEMEEVDVVKKTFDFLAEHSKYRLWIDNHPAYTQLNAKDYPLHNIIIKGFIPDIIVFNQFESSIFLKFFTIFISF